MWYSSIIHYLLKRGISVKYSSILDRVQIEDFCESLRSNPYPVIEKAESAYAKKIEEACDMISEDNRQIVLITGPSGSGKTTTAQKIAEGMRARGKKINSVSLDNFYKSETDLPRWQDGYQNYESIEGLDLEHFEKVVKELLHTGRAQFPIFDWATNRRAAESIDLRFDRDTILIFEGIHALNPLISEPVSTFPSMKIYISTHSEFYHGAERLLTARDLRLTRRILRDYSYRATSADETFQMWDYVLKGEDLYIRPYRQYADLHIDSTHAYEPYLYRQGILHALDSACSACHLETISRLRASYQHFFNIDLSLVPKTSLIQEFIKQDD